MKIVKYGNGMRAQKWYTSECPHCHTVWKNTEFEVVYVDEDQKTLDHPSPFYKATCPVCGKEELHYLKTHNYMKSLLKFNTLGMIKGMMRGTIISALVTFGIICIPNIAVRGILSAISLGAIIAFALMLLIDCDD